MQIKIALCQMTIVDDLKANLKKAESMIGEAAKKGAQIVVLPEMFQTPYENTYFIDYAEEKGTTYSFLKNTAKKHKILLIGGSYAYRTEEGLFNSCFIFNENGDEIGKHSKAHLFDIDVPGGIKFKESDTLTSGDEITVIDSKYGKIGIAICYDMRFPELYRSMAMEGAEIIITPAAFNMTTGPAHWHKLAQSRALDNQVFHVLCSPARDDDGVYVAYGHSLVSDPCGEIIDQLDEKENLLITTIDKERLQEVRKAIPTYQHLKWGLYNKSFDYLMVSYKKNLHYINAANRYLKDDCWMESVCESQVIRNHHWALPLFEDEKTLQYFFENRCEDYVGFPGVSQTIYNFFMDKYKIVWHNPCKMYVYEGELFEIEDDYDIGPLTIDDFDIVHDHYSYQSDISENYIKNIIKNNKTLAVRVDGSPVSWLVEHMDGSLGIMYTLDDYRRRGLGQILTKHMINWYLKEDMIPYIHIEESNQPSISLAQGLGFQYHDTVHWFGAVKEKNVSK